MRALGSSYDCRHTRTSTITKWQTLRCPQGNDIQDDMSGIDSQMEPLVKRSEAEGTRTPRPYASDFGLAESDFEAVLQTHETASSDTAGMQSEIEEISCAPAAPPDDVCLTWRRITRTCGAQGME